MLIVKIGKIYFLTISNTQTPAYGRNRKSLRIAVDGDVIEQSSAFKSLGCKISNMRFKFLSSLKIKTRHRVNSQVHNNVSEKYTVSIFSPKIKEVSEGGDISPKSWYLLAFLNGAIFQENNIVKISNDAMHICIHTYRRIYVHVYYIP
jgi:hypothetical protein